MLFFVNPMGEISGIKYFIVRIYAIVLVVLFFVVFFTMVATYQPYNLLLGSSSAKSNMLTNKIAPQGWSFFTRDPRESALEVYSWSVRGINKIGIKGSSHTNFFGLKKDFRIYLVESGGISSKIVDWNKGDSIKSLSNMSFCPELNIESPFKSKLICGDLIFVKRKRVPWSYRNFLSAKDMPIEFSMVKVNCVD